jgi:hypothetical protein
MSIHDNPNTRVISGEDDEGEEEELQQFPQMSLSQINSSSQPAVTHNANPPQNSPAAAAAATSPNSAATNSSNPSAANTASALPSVQPSPDNSSKRSAAVKSLHAKSNAVYKSSTQFVHNLFEDNVYCPFQTQVVAGLNATLSILQDSQANTNYSNTTLSQFNQQQQKNNQVILEKLGWNSLVISPNAHPFSKSIDSINSVQSLSASEALP